MSRLILWLLRDLIAAAPCSFNPELALASVDAACAEYLATHTNPTPMEAQAA